MKTQSNPAENIRQHYIKNPPDGMTVKDIRRMSTDDLLDMHYFLTEEFDEDDNYGEEGFYIF